MTAYKRKSLFLVYTTNLTSIGRRLCSYKLPSLWRFRKRESDPPGTLLVRVAEGEENKKVHSVLKISTQQWDTSFLFLIYWPEQITWTILTFKRGKASLSKSIAFQIFAFGDIIWCLVILTTLLGPSHSHLLMFWEFQVLSCCLVTRTPRVVPKSILSLKKLIKFIS